MSSKDEAARSKVIDVAVHFEVPHIFTSYSAASLALGRVCDRIHITPSHRGASFAAWVPAFPLQTATELAL